MDKKKNSIMRPSFDEVLKMDQALQFLASYEVSGGKIIIPKSMEEMMELNKKIADKFNYFKRLIHTGECTFEFIKGKVLAKNGPFPRDTDFSLLPSLENDNRKIDPLNDPSKELIEKLVQSLFPDAMIEKIECNPNSSEPQVYKTKITLGKKKRKSKKRKN